MFALDDRTGNVLTTAALFAAVAGVVYAARAALVVFVLALLFAYLLEPAVAWVQRHLPTHPSSRWGAIAAVYVALTLVAAGLGYAIAPALAAQFARLSSNAPELAGRLTDTRFLAQHAGAIADGAERAAVPVSAAAGVAAWLLMVPVVAVFFLGNRVTFIDGLVDFLARRRDRASVKRTVEQVDVMLAQYTRAQLALAGFSFVFYSVSMAVLRFPYPLVLGILGGVLEFIPVVGWILSAAVILTAGYAAHAPWIWMAGLIVGWRFVQNFVISPRVMANRLQMEPISVIFALMAGGEIGGLLGVILAVPAVAVVRILWLDRESRQKAAAA